MSRHIKSLDDSELDHDLAGEFDALDIDTDAMSSIVASHFNTSCTFLGILPGGFHAHPIKYRLGDGKRIVARIVTHPREGVKTEAEVAAMDCMRARTTIPVPKVHLFCSTIQNPVRAEWIIMDFVEGIPWEDCYEQLSYEQQRTAGVDLARVMSETFSLTATHCGSLLDDCSLRPDQRAARYNIGGAFRVPHSTAWSIGTSGTFAIGPANDSTFINEDDPVHAALCGPFPSERAYLEAVAYRGRPRDDPSNGGAREVFKRVMDVYDAVRPLYRALDSADAPTFHFAHNDLFTTNILLDTATGHITGIIDWDRSGFVPGWQAGYPGINHFGDDCSRFTVAECLDGPDALDEPAEAQEVRESFRDALRSRDPTLWDNHWDGVELRAILWNLGIPEPERVRLWVEKYKEYHWDPILRGPFPANLATSTDPS
ncbi:kinase-like protein [Phanerochaete sordida]|uniref:Kinase-like protein n=1 Tax=Phanerochaete sordida TaxID=48140 RepID=A0A9P3LIK8_9APHY|nr:kinase-like protein [Phanerochaete sordida]